eukprot:6762700-Prorocentrum_lima.AAC.1
MTSSLVGSEMCIRDRPRSLPHPQTASSDPARATVSRNVAPIVPYASYPVSYTHLTLPTICSV